MSGFADGDVSAHADGQMVTVSIADRSALGQAARRLDDAGLVMDELSIRRPSLDEVFLSLTGHAAEAGPDERDEEVTEERSRA